MTTAFYHAEECLWHRGEGYSFLLPTGGLVEPMAAGGLPESPESKRRLVNLMRVTGLIDAVDLRSPAPADEEALARVHPASYRDEFRRLSDGRGGELGLRTPFGPGAYGIAARAAGLAVAALADVLDGRARNAYALTRPPGHHALPDYPMGFCLFANIAIAVEAALANGQAERIAVIDWDVHHGNGTEAIFYDRPEVLAVSLHQDRNFPPDTGAFADRGEGPGEGANLNVPLPPGSGHATYLAAFERIVAPAVRAFRPDAVVVACGFDASGLDPLSRMLLHGDSFAALTRMAMDLAAETCGGRLVLCHEGGYSEAHVPFCGHKTIETLLGRTGTVDDPLQPRVQRQQPDERLLAYQLALVDEMAGALGHR